MKKRRLVADEAAQAAVSEVPNDLVADQPHGALRRRPPFNCVIDKFVAGALRRWWHEDESVEVTTATPSRKKRPKHKDDEDLPYGILLVWGNILAELEKTGLIEEGAGLTEEVVLVEEEPESTLSDEISPREMRYRSRYGECLPPVSNSSEEKKKRSQTPTRKTPKKRKTKKRKPCPIVLSDGEDSFDEYFPELKMKRAIPVYDETIRYDQRLPDDLPTHLFVAPTNAFRKIDVIDLDCDADDEPVVLERANTEPSKKKTKKEQKKSFVHIPLSSEDRRRKSEYQARSVNDFRRSREFFDRMGGSGSVLVKPMMGYDNANYD